MGVPSLGSHPSQVSRQPRPITLKISTTQPPGASPVKSTPDPSGSVSLASPLDPTGSVEVWGLPCYSRACRSLLGGEGSSPHSDGQARGKQLRKQSELPRDAGGSRSSSAGSPSSWHRSPSLLKTQKSLHLGCRPKGVYLATNQDGDHFHLCFPTCLKYS